MLQRKWFRLAIAIAYFFCTLFLFLLPGSAFPRENWFSKILWFDKWVHIGLFLVLVLLFCWAAEALKNNNIYKILILAIVYGIVVEIIQDRFVVNRSFDWTDWIADIVGSVLGILVWRVYKKNRPL